jgi:hypothetical protein
MVPQPKGLPGCCWNYCTTAAFTFSYDPDLCTVLWHFLEGANTWTQHYIRSGTYGRWSKSFLHFCNILGCDMGLVLLSLISCSLLPWTELMRPLHLWDTHTSIHRMHSPVNFGWLTILGTKELNNTLLILFAEVLHPECWNLTMSHCSHFLLIWPCSVPQLMVHCLCVMHTIIW